MDYEVYQILEIIKENKITDLLNLYNFLEEGRIEEVEEKSKINLDFDDDDLFYSYNKLLAVLNNSGFFLNIFREIKEAKFENSRKIIEKTYFLEG